MYVRMYVDMYVHIIAKTKLGRGNLSLKMFADSELSLSSCKRSQPLFNERLKAVRCIPFTMLSWKKSKQKTKND